FPIFVKAAQDAHLVTVDDLSLIDFWQGHFANILGHMRNNFADDLTNTEPQLNFQLGCNTEIEQQVAEELCRLTSSEQALFCTTGAQATMSAILIGLAHTGRRHVLKIQGGWHGVQPWSLVSVKSEDAPSRRAIESLGLPTEFVESVVTVRF